MTSPLGFINSSRCLSHRLVYVQYDDNNNNIRVCIDSQIDLRRYRFFFHPSPSSSSHIVLLSFQTLQHKPNLMTFRNCIYFFHYCPSITSLRPLCRNRSLYMYNIIFLDVSKFDIMFLHHSRGDDDNNYSVIIINRSSLEQLYSIIKYDTCELRK